MIINQLKNINLISLTILFTILNIGFNSSLAEAKPDKNVSQSILKLSLAGTLDAATSSDHQIEQINLEQDGMELSNTKQTIPPHNQSIISSSFGGQASWYGPGFHGRLTANGERYNQNAMTAAHRSLKFGTRVRVTNLNNGRSVVVRINDRGPFIKGRVIDVSAAAARTLNMMHSGVAPVKVTILGQ